MSRVKRGVIHLKKRRRVLKRTKGFNNGRKNLIKQALTASIKAGAYAFRDRRAKKRDFRALWQIKISANVFLDGKKREGKTNLLLSHLIPKEYTVRIEKDGYLPWEKKFPLRSGEAVVLPDVQLFSAASGTNTIASNIGNPVFLSDARIIYQKKDANGTIHIYLFDGDNENDIFSNPLATSISLPEPSSVIENKIIFKTTIADADIYYLLYLNQNKLLNISDIISDSSIISASDLSENNIVTSPADDFIYVSKENYIYKINPVTNSISAILAETRPIIQFFIHNDYIYYMVAWDGQNQLYINKNTENSIPQLVSSIDSADRYHIHNENSAYAVIINQQKQKAMLVRKTNSGITINTIDDPVKDMVWAKDMKNMIYFSDFEIWNYDIEKDEKQLIIRQSAQISSAQIDTDRAKIYYLQKDYLTATELQNQLGRYFTPLAEQGGSSLQLNKKGDALYWLSSDNGVMNLYGKKLF